MRIGIGVSLDPDPGKAALDAVRQAKRAVPKPDLALAFGAITLDQKKVHEALAAELDPAVLFGGSSYAEITPAGVTKNSVAVLLLSFDDAKVHVGGGGVGKDSTETLKNLLAAFPGREKNGGLPLGLFFTSIEGSYDDRFLAEVSKGLGGVPVFGVTAVSVGRAKYV